MRLRSFPYACLLFGTLCGAYFLVFFQRLSLGVIMPSLAEDLSLTPSMTGWLGSAFLYSYAATQLPAGFMVDNWGPRRTMLLLFGVGGIGGILFASATNVGTAILGRALVGVGMAVVTTASFKIMSNWFAKNIYARLVSIFMAVGGMGTFLSSTPLVALNDTFGWRVVFWGIAVFSLFWGILLMIFVHDYPNSKQRKELSLDISVSYDENTQKNSIKSTLFHSFIILLSSKQYRYLTLWYLTSASLFFSFAGLWATDYYSNVHNLSSEHAGYLLSLGAFSLIFGTPAGAWLSDKLRSRKKVLLLGSLCAIGSSLSLCFAPSPLPEWGLWIQFGGLCFAGNATASVLFTAAREALPPSVLGISTSVLSFSLFACTACIQAAMGAVLESLLPFGLECAYERAFLIYLFLSCIGLITILRLND